MKGLHALCMQTVLQEEKNMLKVNVNFEKDAVSPKNKNGAMLLEINMEKGKKVLTVASDTGEKYLSLNIYK